jgi:hypothetical protein
MDFDATGNAVRRLALIAGASITCLMGRASAAPLDSQVGIATDLSFIENQVTKTLKSLGSPASNYPVSGGDTGTWTTTSPSSGSKGWTSGFFPGELWLLYQATGSHTWLTAAQNWTAPLASQASSVTRVDPTDIGFIIGTSFGNGYRLTGETSYKDVLITAGNSLASLYNAKVGAVRSWTFAQFQFPVIIDSMMTLGPLQWGATNGGTPAWAVDASTHAKTVTAKSRALERQHVPACQFQPDYRGAGVPRVLSDGRPFCDVSLGARAGLGPVWIRAGLSDVR